MNFSGHYAYVSGWTGVTVLDTAQPASPQVVGVLPLPHFENEDVDLCGNLLLVVNDREAEDLGSIMYVVSITTPTTPTVIAILLLGLTGSGRGSGHIANFVKPDCSQAWVDGGNLVEVVDLTNPAAPASLGRFESAASLSENFKVSHDTELDSTGTIWNVGGGGAAGYKLTANPLTPKLLATTGSLGRNPSPYNDRKRTSSRLATTSRRTARPGPPTGRRPTRTARSSTRPTRSAALTCCGSRTAA